MGKGGSKRKELKRRERRKRISRGRNIKKGENKMMKCPFCSDDREIPIRKNQITEHLVAVKDSNNHIHVHGPVSNTELIKEFILKIGEEADIDIEDDEEN